ncbi:Uncharacterised protein [Capnocytophaga canimorsus]|nr:hypothetical protein CLV61_1884 [Capnocytophaga canimorsus]STA71368.1 Uncharacterised protein [Capnocytophaga canimorsus]
MHKTHCIGHKKRLPTALKLFDNLFFLLRYAQKRKSKKINLRPKPKYHQLFLWFSYQVLLGSICRLLF